MLSRIKDVLKRAPLVPSISHTRTARKLQYSLRLRFGKRQNYTYTQFLRLPTQYKILCRPVIELAKKWRGDREIRIAVMGSSYGAEAYSIASTIRASHPQLKFAVRAFDLDTAVIAKARVATYTYNEVANAARVSPEFVAFTFDRRDKDGVTLYAVKPEIRSLVTFAPADALDPRLAAAVGKADIVFAQNFLYHLRPSVCRAAFVNLATLVDSHGVMFLDGMDLGLKTRLVNRFGLLPLDQAIEEIHAEAYRERGASWPGIYWGLEELNRSRPDWKTRYATIFVRED